MMDTSLKISVGVDRTQNRWLVVATWNLLPKGSDCTERGAWRAAHTVATVYQQDVLVATRSISTARCLVWKCVEQQGNFCLLLESFAITQSYIVDAYPY